MPPADPTAGHLRAIRGTLLRWYERERRDFPWRRTADPYAVLVSEVMLQQTQASRVAERFEPFMRRFPTPAALASAPSSAVLAAWSGLGYNRRALALQRTAGLVDAAGWPRDVAGLEALPGVGPYTARALASLAFGEPVGTVDTNVRRWLIRRIGLPDQPRELQRTADALAAPGRGDPAAAAAWTHASMEFGASICRARNPACASCPVADGCPSRAAPPAVPVVRQPPYAGSDRALRGAVLRELAGARRHVRTFRALGRRIGPSVSADRLDRVVAALERDRLVTCADGMVRLGSEASTLATIA